MNTARSEHGAVLWDSTAAGRSDSCLQGGSKLQEAFKGPLSFWRSPRKDRNPGVYIHPYTSMYILSKNLGIWIVVTTTQLQAALFIYCSNNECQYSMYIDIITMYSIVIDGEAFVLPWMQWPPFCLPSVLGDWISLRSSLGFQDHWNFAWANFCGGKPWLFR